MTEQEKTEIKNYLMWLDLNYLHHADQTSLEVFSALYSLNSEYPQFEDPQYRLNIFKKVSEILERFSSYEDILSKPRITKDFNLQILKDGDDPELYEDMPTVENAYLKLGALEDTYEEAHKNG